MGSIYLTWLADELRAAGARVHEYDNQWKTRARSSGGFNATPLGVSWHHTAGAKGASAQSECDYMVRSSDARPTCNIYIARDGVVWVLAAGASNTSGKGGPLTMSRGQVPKDCANTTTVGMEIGNNGTGEQYPQAQIDAAFLASNVINRRLGNRPTDLFSHQRYAPDRKIDPATAAAVQGPWKPRSCSSSGTWNCDDICAEAERRAGGTQPGAGARRFTDEEDDDVKMILKGAGNDSLFVYSGTAICALISWTIAERGGGLGMWDQNQILEVPWEDVQNTINQCWQGGPVPAGYVQPPARLP